MTLTDFVISFYYYTLEVPVTAVRGFVERQQAKQKFYFYHRQYPRVTSIEDCLLDDMVCAYEANEQWKRDKKVEEEIIKILNRIFEKCVKEEGPSARLNCKQVLKEYEEASDNFDTKYGNLGYSATAFKCLQKQKDRMMKEKRMQPPAAH